MRARRHHFADSGVPTVRAVFCMTWAASAWSEAEASESKHKNRDALVLPQGYP